MARASSDRIGTPPYDVMGTVGIRHDPCLPIQYPATVPLLPPALPLESLHLVWYLTTGLPCGKSTLPVPPLAVAMLMLSLPSMAPLVSRWSSLSLIT